jgi:hypothetical protein
MKVATRDHRKSGSASEVTAPMARRSHSDSTTPPDSAVVQMKTRTTGKNCTATRRQSPTATSQPIAP